MWQIVVTTLLHYWVRIRWSLRYLLHVYFIFLPEYISHPGMERLETSRVVGEGQRRCTNDLSIALKKGTSQCKQISTRVKVLNIVKMRGYNLT